MRLWPFHRRRKPCPSDDAIAADQEASRALIDAEALTSRADRVADRLSATRERNHFAAAVYRSIRGV